MINRENWDFRDYIGIRRSKTTTETESKQKKQTTHGRLFAHLKQEEENFLFKYTT